MKFVWNDICKCNEYAICGVHKIEEYVYEYIDQDFCEDLLIT